MLYLKIMDVACKPREEQKQQGLKRNFVASAFYVFQFENVQELINFERKMPKKQCIIFKTL